MSQQLTPHCMTLNSVLNQRQAQKLLDTLSSQPNSNISMAPRVTMFNGQEATISDIVQRPFVVSFSPLQDETEKQVATFQPVVQVISGGMLIQLKPELSQDSTSVQLTCAARITRVTGVDTFSFRAAGISLVITHIFDHSKSISQ